MAPSSKPPHSQAVKDSHEKLQSLLNLSHELAAESRGLAILGEGNTSAKLDRETFLVKASGSSLATLAASDVVECRFLPLLALLDHDTVEDWEIEKILFGSRVDAAAPKPSVEALFHAWFLSLPGVDYVGHTHPVSVNQILCSPHARAFATCRLFPDEIVCCGATSVFIPYTDPGLKLAQRIRLETSAFIQQSGFTPRLVLLENHGVVALGASPEAVQAAMFMADKAARIFVGAAALGGPQFLSSDEVHRIAHRLDELHRQRVLKL